MDEADYIGEFHAKRFENYLDGIYQESGADVRFIFARQVPGDLESYALKRAREMGIGRETDKRGMLFVYDVGGRRMRIEVGPGLEGVFPDGFVGYLMREQTELFFASGNRVLGLKSTMDIVNNRLREAALGGAYDPRAVAYITNSVRLAEGAGANAKENGRRGIDLWLRQNGVVKPAVRARFGPQPTVAAAPSLYLEALRDGQFEPDLPLYTPGTQAILRQFPTTAPFADFILFSEYGHKYIIVERGDLAILFFTTTPIVSAHLFRRSPAGWQLDIAAEVQDTREFVASPYTWGMMLSGDDYSRAFADLFEDFGPLHLASGYRPMPTRLLRPARGDNRPLPTRFGCSAQRLASVSSDGSSRSSGVLLPANGTNTENFGYPQQTVDRVAVRQLLLARSYDALDTLLTAYADSASRDYRLEYRLFDAYAAFDVAIPSLEPLLSEWVHQHPASAAALLARATFFGASGWNARGTKFARRTSRNQFSGMEDFFQRAVADSRAALRLAPNSIVAYRQLMRIARSHGDPETSRQIFDRAIKFQPYSFLMREEYIVDLLPRWGGSYKEMEQFAEESAPYAAHNPRIRALGGFVDWDRGRVLESDGLKDKAITAYGRALRSGNYSRFRFERADLYWHLDRYEEAMADLNIALLQEPHHAQALYERAYAGYDLGRKTSREAGAAYYTQAYRDIKLSVALDPTDSYHQRYLSFIRRNLPEFANCGRS
jgi:tetratricopeptide (TPR) repeat protein